MASLTCVSSQPNNLSLSLPLNLPLSHSVWLSLTHSVSLSVSLSPFLTLSFCLYLCVTVSLPHSLRKRSRNWDGGWGRESISNWLNIRIKFNDRRAHNMRTDHTEVGGRFNVNGAWKAQAVKFIHAWLFWYIPIMPPLYDNQIVAGSWIKTLDSQ